jgi:hypothetical protein
VLERRQDACPTEAKNTAHLWATIVARLEAGDSLKTIAADLNLPWVKGIHHTTLITWIRQVGEHLPNAYAPDQVPPVEELDELETFIGQKKDLDLDCR